MDGDAIADLFEVNYCRSNDPYEVACRNKKGISTCPPLKFDAEPDRVWRGNGDGTFQQMTSQCMNPISPGRGLDLVVGTLDERPGLDVFVANDMTVNHLWSANDSPAGFQFVDLGAIRSLGFNSRSLSQASMGMAVGDPDGDGGIDFFLTHFSGDHNTYYEQVVPGAWLDRTVQVGLSTPSMHLLGFGTQWVDFDNNGTLGLIVANGHVDESDKNDTAFRMPPQLFTRQQTGRWVEQGREQLGDYFSNDPLGRALVRLDADRDGRMDVAVTHLYEPVSLLINRTLDSGRSIGFQLFATTSQRDAIVRNWLS